MFSEDDLLPISALQHLLFCERQCALIHIERLWVENRLTVEGRHLHDKAHGAAGPRGGGLRATRGEVHLVRGLPLRSLELGLAGVADVVEFHADAPPTPLVTTLPAAADGESRDTSSPRAADALPSTPFPVEYKRGRPKVADCDRVQLCAQALCLEEMLHLAVPCGALFYGRTRRREEVAFDTALRARTADAAARLHELLRAGTTPAAVAAPKCRQCSLLALCIPEVTDGRHSAAAFVSRSVRAMLAAPTDEEGAA
jgi:CRISPR-associated exonuclease Cas4